MNKLCSKQFCPIITIAEDLNFLHLTPHFKKFKIIKELVYLSYKHVSTCKSFWCIQHLLNAFVFFQMLPVIVFFSSTIAVLYYTGIMPAIIRTISWFLCSTMDITPAEGLTASGNIFLGPVC